MEIPPEIIELVERFGRNIETYKRDDYKETRVRVEFIDPFFEALGWDVRNVSGQSEQYKDVVHEDAISIKGKTRAPDYSFRIGGARKFFLEAKKPSVDIKDNIGPAYQLRRYSWSVKLPIGILTDFEEFAVYDCLHSPKATDNANVGQLLYVTFDQYLDRFDEISKLFTKESVQQGSLDQFAQAIKKKRGTSEVDSELLKEIEGWRDVLARNIAVRNEHLSVNELNFAVQRTIDRIIFLRMAEDRGIEDYGKLRDLAGTPEIYPRLKVLYKLADEKYNAGLFDFTADTLTPGLIIDDKVLKPILENLYYPKSPYEFSVMPVEILGQVYEQFLGKVIRLTRSHRAKIEEKPEVKKAGGVYYTPSYIVNYIVKQTVGNLVEGKSPKQVSKLRILDPACGSGSFLLGAFQYLLNYHLGWYETHDPSDYAKEKQPAVYQGKRGEWRLTSNEKKRILLNNIYGVDIDRQAVEVTKLSLLLKVLEGETEESLGQQLSLWRERALPNLGENIKCGNSLIGFNYFEGKLFIDEKLREELNPFDWQREYSEVFSKGGFDILIGNPPYIRIQAMKEWAPNQVEFLKKKYISASKGNYDIYVVFIERALSLLNINGQLGFILPHKFFNSKYGETIRELISKGKHISKIVHFEDQQVFENATTYTCLLFLKKQEQSEFEFTKIRDLNAWRENNKSIDAYTSGMIDSRNITSKEWNFVVGKGASIYEKLNEMPVKLEDIALRIFQGFKTGADPVFILDNLENGRYYSKALNSEIFLETYYLRPLYKSGEMKRYSLKKNSRSVIFPYKNRSLIDWNEISTNSPKTAEYLRSCKPILDKREKGRWTGEHWYCYSRNQALEVISNKKILTADLNPSANYCFDKTGEACFPGGAAGGYGIILDENMYLYVLGLLNSKAVDYYHKLISTNFRGGWFGYSAKIIRNIPIKAIDFSNPSEKEYYSKIVNTVEQILSAQEQLTNIKTLQEKSILERLIYSLDHSLDLLVYDLYKLNEKEIKIVENYE